MIGKYIRFKLPSKGYKYDEYGGIVLDKVKCEEYHAGNSIAVDRYVVEVTEQKEGYDEWGDLSTPLIKLADPEMITRIVHADEF
jgi:hypothetical protein